MPWKNLRPAAVAAAVAVIVAPFTNDVGSASSPDGKVVSSAPDTGKAPPASVAPPVYRASDGFAFSLPAGWGILDQGPRSFASAATAPLKPVKFGSPESPVVFLTFAWESGEAAITDEFLRKTGGKAVTAHKGTQSKVHDASIIRIADRDCGNIEISADLGAGFPIRQRMVIIPGGGRTNFLVFTAPESGYQEESKKMRSVLASLVAPEAGRLRLVRRPGQVVRAHRHVGVHGFDRALDRSVAVPRGAPERTRPTGGSKSVRAAATAGRTAR